MARCTDHRGFVAVVSGPLITNLPFPMGFIKDNFLPRTPDSIKIATRDGMSYTVEIEVEATGMSMGAGFTTFRNNCQFEKDDILVFDYVRRRNELGVRIFDAATSMERVMVREVDYISLGGSSADRDQLVPDLRPTAFKFDPTKAPKRPRSVRARAGPSNHPSARARADKGKRKISPVAMPTSDTSDGETEKSREYQRSDRSRKISKVYGCSRRKLETYSKSRGTYSRHRQYNSSTRGRMAPGCSVSPITPGTTSVIKPSGLKQEKKLSGAESDSTDLSGLMVSEGGSPSRPNNTWTTISTDLSGLLASDLVPPKKKSKSGRMRQTTLSGGLLRGEASNPSGQGSGTDTCYVSIEHEYVGGRCSLELPSMWGQAHTTAGVNSRKMIVQGGRKTWNIKCRNDGEECKITFGWKKFSRDNKIEVGDVVTIDELPSDPTTWFVGILNRK